MCAFPLQLWLAKRIEAGTTPPTHWTTSESASSPFPACGPSSTPLVQWAREQGSDGRRPADHPAVRTKLATFRVEIEVLQMLAFRNLGMLERGEHPEHEASMVKIFSTELMQRLQNAATKMLGLHGQLTQDEVLAPAGGRFEQGYISAVMPTFGAGANEVMRNIIATRGLGLPRQ